MTISASSKILRIYLAAATIKSNLKIKLCRIAEKEHRSSRRQYAHVNHLPGVICVSKSIWELPDSHLSGVLAHEIGHLFASNWSEEAADKATNKMFGITILYASTDFGENLQYLQRDDIMKFLQKCHIMFKKETKRQN
ncbi:MAG: M48 family metalloprotease [Candidatus Woesearchaeota archaeon]